MKKYSFIAILFTIASSVAFGQISILPGTTFVIDSGTTVTLNNSTLDTLKIASGTSFTNNGAIHLSPLTSIEEQAGNPIVGLGYEKYTDEYMTPLLATNLGGLGIMISTTIAPDSLTVKRFHSPLTNSGMNGIARSYEVIAENNVGLGATAVVNYDVTELNGNLYNNLMLYQSGDVGLSWEAIYGTPATYNVTATGIDSVSLFSLFSFDFKIDSLNALSFYHGDSIKIYYTVNGVLNTGNKLKFEFSDELGSFAIPFQFDSIPSIASGSGVLTKAIPVALVPGTLYRIRLATTDVAMLSTDNGSDVTIMNALTTSINESAEGDGSIYPNPASNTIYVDAKKLKQIKVTDEIGRILIQADSKDYGILTVNVSELPPAVYFITIETTEGVMYRRFVKI